MDEVLVCEVEWGRSFLKGNRTLLENKGEVKICDSIDAPFIHTIHVLFHTLIIKITIVICFYD